MKLPKFLLALVLLVAPAAAHGQGEAVRLGGELRLRFEAERPAAPADTFDTFTLLRARLGLDAALSPAARVFLQLQDARAFGEEASTADGSADRLDLHQGWLELATSVAGTKALVRAGRQEIALGNERLVGAVGWSNTGRSFDAARVMLGPGGESWTLNLLAATVRERGRRNVASSADRDDHLLLGGYLDMALLDAWALLDRGENYRGYLGADRATLGGRFELRPVGGFSAWAEGSYQLGSQLRATPEPAAEQEQDIAAYMFGGRAAYAFGSKALRSISAGADYLSGDEDPFDDEHGAFNTLYHTGHKWYGYIDLFLDPAARTGERGLVDLLASVTVGLAAEAPLTLDVHAFSTAAQRAFEEQDDIGLELDATLPLALGPGQRLQLGYSLFRNGAMAPALGLGDEDAVWHWGYAMVTFAFGGR